MKSNVKGIHPQMRTLTRAQKAERSNLIRFIFSISLVFVLSFSLLKLIGAGYNAIADATAVNIIINTTFAGLVMYHMHKALQYIEKL